MTTFRVALTFDAEHPDRPHRSGATERVLDLLDDEAIKATFFLQGRWVRPTRRSRATWPREAISIGNHSFYHARMPLLSTSGLATDIRAAERAIVAATGVDPKPWFRCPFGAGTTIRRCGRASRVSATARSTGMSMAPTGGRACADAGWPAR